jgi:hypothetical protein
VQLPKEQSIVTAKLDLQSLNWQLKTCRDDIKEWLDLAKSLDLASLGRIETFFKRLRVAVNKDGFSEFHR